jgi:aquaporin Z
MNPARSFGPDLANWNFTSYWVYLAGPIAGALTAVVIAFILRGRGGDVGGLAAARGALDKDVQAARAAPSVTP